MSLVTTARLICGQNKRLSTSTSAVLPLPTGPATPTRNALFNVFSRQEWGKRVDIGERDRWNVGDNLVRSQPLMLVPHYDIEHTDTMAGDTCFTAADIRDPADPRLSIDGRPATFRRPSC